MKLFSSIRTRTILCLSLWAALAGEGRSQVFTVQVGDASLPLVSHGELWHYRKGNSEPQTDWKTTDDTDLDASWLIGPGGFGYGDNDDATVLSDMLNSYNTVYIRKSFSADASTDPSRRVLLKMDWDDGFVAYLDGVEVVRSPNVAVANPLFNSQTVVGQNHEASAGGGAAPTTYDLGTAGSLLPPGIHVLAVHGLNSDPASTDLSLIADLSLSSGAQGVVAGPLLAIVNSASVVVSGTNTIAGTSRLTINGVDAAFNAVTGAWSKQQPLTPGCNRLVVEAVAANGAVLFSTNQVVVSEVTSTTITSLAGDTVFDPSMGVIHVPNHLTVPSEGSLVINPGTVLLFGPGITLRSTNDASLIINGTRDNPVCLFTADGLTMWGELAADGANAFLTVRHAELIGGAVKGRHGAICLLEDSYFHDYKNGTVPIGGCTSAQSMTVRRCHFRVYHETLWQVTPMIIEDCLFELANNPSSDALDFDGAVSGSVIRHCTFRHGPQGNTDAIDIGPLGNAGCTNTLIADSLMYDFPNDKGVSVGDIGTSHGIVVSNCLIYGCLSGVMAKDSCDVSVRDCTIVNNAWGFTNYNKSGSQSYTGGHTINTYNNILWNNGVAISMIEGGTLTADHNDFGNITWPGEGNFDFDPLFVNPAGRDYRLTPNSPCIGTGRDGADMGAHFPVGAPMASSHPYFTSISVINSAVELSFWVDSEKNYTVQASETAAPGSWSKVADVYHQMVSRFAKVTSPIATNYRFYRLVTPVQP